MFALHGLVQVSFADDPEFSGFGIHIIYIEIGLHVYTLVVSGEVYRGRAGVAAFYPEKNTPGPDKHPSAVVE